MGRSAFYGKDMMLALTGSQLLVFVFFHLSCLYSCFVCWHFDWAGFPSVPRVLPMYVFMAQVEETVTGKEKNISALTFLYYFFFNTSLLLLIETKAPGSLNKLTCGHFRVISSHYCVCAGVFVQTHVCLNFVFAFFFFSCHSFVLVFLARQSPAVRHRTLAVRSSIAASAGPKKIEAHLCLSALALRRTSNELTSNQTRLQGELRPQRCNYSCVYVCV